jgi:excisionase family DNA binding protein
VPETFTRDHGLSNGARDEVHLMPEKSIPGKPVARAIAGERARSRDVWTVEEVAAYLRLHPGTVYRLIGRGQLPAFKVGNDWRFFSDVVDEWLISEISRRSPKP